MLGETCRTIRFQIFEALKSRLGNKTMLRCKAHGNLCSTVLDKECDDPHTTRSRIACLPLAKCMEIHRFVNTDKHEECSFCGETCTTFYHRHRIPFAIGTLAFTKFEASGKTFSHPTLPNVELCPTLSELKCQEKQQKKNRNQNHDWKHKRRH